jgi:4-alpha-glucanotransferase
MPTRNPARLAALAEEAEQIVIQSESRSETIYCKFRLHYVAEFGQLLHLIGSDASLGNWNPEHSVLMQWQPGNFWVADAQLSRLIPTEYKYLVKNDDGSVCRWEEGPNHILSMPNYVNATLKVYDHWGSR